MLNKVLFENNNNIVKNCKYNFIKNFFSWYLIIIFNLVNTLNKFDPIIYLLDKKLISIVLNYYNLTYL